MRKGEFLELRLELLNFLLEVVRRLLLVSKLVLINLELPFKLSLGPLLVEIVPLFLQLELMRVSLITRLHFDLKSLFFKQLGLKRLFQVKHLLVVVFFLDCLFLSDLR